MKNQILKAIKDTQIETREVGIYDNGTAVLRCGNKEIDIQPYLTQQGEIVLQVILGSKSGDKEYLRDLMVTPESMVNLAVIFNKYISQAFEKSEEVNMAELILSDQEKKQSWAEADEVALGKAVKYVAFQLGLSNNNDDYQPAILTACVQTIGVMMHHANATEGTFSVDNLTFKGEPLGNWEVKIKQTSKPKKEVAK